MRKKMSLCIALVLVAMLASCKSIGVKKNEVVSNEQITEKYDYQKLVDMFIMDNYTYDATQSDSKDNNHNISKKRGSEIKEEKISKTLENTYKYFETGQNEGYATQSVEVCVPEGIFQFKTYDGCIIKEWIMADVMDFHTQELEFCTKDDAIEQVKAILEYAGIEVSDQVDVGTIDQAYYEEMNKQYDKAYGLGTRLHVLEENSKDPNADYTQWKECYYMKFNMITNEEKKQEMETSQTTNVNNAVEVVFSEDGVEMLNVYF